jgi:hypothetical protein
VQWLQLNSISWGIATLHTSKLVCLPMLPGSNLGAEK